MKKTSFLLARPLQGFFQLPLILWIEQGGSLLHVTLRDDLCDGLTNLGKLKSSFVDHLIT